MDCCTIVADQFDEARVAAKLEERRTEGAAHTTDRLTAMLAELGVEGMSLLDIGAGFGDVERGLFPRGLGRAAHVDISEPYSLAAREIATTDGYADRLERHVGDFVEIAGEIAPADIVVLDRVICCYERGEVLVERSLDKAGRLYAVSVPRSHPFARLFFGCENLLRRWRRSPFRMRIRSRAWLDARVGARGFRPVRECRTPLWHIVVFVREAPRGPGTEDD